MSRNVRGAVAVVAVVGAIVGAAAASSAPTGHAQIDAAQRAAVAAVVALAATRAHRWSLVLAAVAVTVAASGGWAILGMAALAGAGWLVIPNRRHRVVAAAVGASIAVTALHLDIGRFHGDSALLGIAACTVVLGAGCARLDPLVRRRWGIAVATAAIVPVATTGVAALFLAVSRADLEQARTLTESGVTHLRDGRTERAAAAFSAAADRFAATRRLIGSEVLAPTRLIPVVSQNLSAVRDVVAAGEGLAGAAADAAVNVDYGRVRRPDGGIDLAVVTSFRRPVTRTARELEAALAAVDGASRRWLVPPVAEPHREFVRQVQRLAGEADLARIVVERTPELLGGDGERRYLVLLGNPAESRDLGGHVGNWVELTVDDGRFDLVRVGGPRDLADRTASSLVDPAGIPPRLLDMRPARFPQNWSAHPDLPTVAAVGANIYEQVTGRRIDGVVYADPDAFAAFVELAGPVPVPELGDYSIDSSNAAQFVIAEQFERFATDAAADDAMATVIRTVFERLVSIELPGPRPLAELFSPLVREGRFRFWSLHDDAGAMLRRIGLAGELRVPTDGDLVAVVSRNANPSKIDRFLHRVVAVDVGWNPTTGEVSSEVVVTVRNDAPESGASDTVLGNSLGLPTATNVSDLAVVSPFESTRIQVDGRDAPARSQWNDGLWYHEVRLVLPPGGSSEVRVGLEGVVASGRTYRLRVDGQPLVNDDRTSVRVTPRGAAEPVERRFRGPRTRDVAVTFEGT